MNIQYVGEDNRIHSLGDSNALQHWKYIKKIPSGKGFRYFYSQDELRAYYNDKIEKDKIEYAKPQSPSAMREKLTRDLNNERNRHNNESDRLRTERLKTRAKQDDVERRRKNMSMSDYHSEKEKLRKNIKSDREAWDKEWDRHEAEKKKLADRTRNYERYKRTVDKAKNITKSVEDVKKDTSGKVVKGRKKTEKIMKRGKSIAISEAKGVKRASKSILGKGNNFYDAHDTAPKSYSKYDKKKKKFGKNKRTGRIERTMIAAYRKTHPYE